jgi:hypothetical protein
LRRTAAGENDLLISRPLYYNTDLRDSLCFYDDFKTNIHPADSDGLTSEAGKKDSSRLWTILFPVCYHFNEKSAERR